MGRRRKLIRLPFFNFKINKQTIYNIVGFFLVGTAMVSSLSFFSFFSSERDGRLLTKINEFITTKFGIFKILVPLLILLVSAHFFSTKKLKFIRPNISVGALMIFISVLGVFQSGEFGQIIFTNLSLDFSTVGAVIILGIIFVIGWVLFLDTSIDLLLIFIFKSIKSALIFVRKFLFREVINSISGNDKKKRSETKDFILDKKGGGKPLVTAPPSKSQSVSLPQDQLVIKPLTRSSSIWVYPPVSLLSDIDQKEADRGDVKENAATIERTLDSFGIRAKVSEVNYGPAVTQYAIGITMGTKLSRITALSNDLALALAAPTGQVRIEAPIPGRSLVGIEIPNRTPTIVTLKQMLLSPVFANSNDPLLVPLGLDVSGQPQATSIARMPHILIAGATGSGKSVLLNSWISTFMFRTKPEDLRIILVDPKRVELTLYNGIPHLLTEVVVEAQKIISALRWTVSEMENRYKEFSKLKVRNIEGYNAVAGVEKKPYIIFIIDELADLMLFAPGDAEDLITRVAQMARATGIHLLLATQRPSVDVITGLMKANIPCRIAFNVSSMIDSRVIIDMPGAEKLLGKGDMLYLPPDQAKPKRIQGPLISEKEVNQLVRFLKMQVPEVHYTEEITEQEIAIGGRGGTMIIGGEQRDTLFDQAIEIIMQHDKASASLLQRRLSIGYARAARILDQLEAAGYVSPAEGSKPREVIKRPAAPTEETQI
ncbi:DNA translocase FtsK [Candidatus Roizmanbacteria bacterium CG02_land_8_20_14_3_00_36_15]|uniref:DNA translocase FtsK n=1 Tax=Candidatus Roizmanbacteria bacterium CG10_big_fil_rev_8_21_14_0_10_36_26 TaxID=1974851 RepID=A0A2M8KJW6_9BACT|nr:MAG: DNA translocase FtsK [Candidatus Roizmanbacteria bacterium CG03_land_8_20_14_0_80_36_21]PIV38185.1 MAG: DNA translocase FtsK [Candidatus Roizmanbacteria bacterium CG02_land_8_20_14_3_00_36_15]PIY69575.1 MAG: DNA translocase FtsK [Candidatus Roizmanbacteria bacterium CG_4_10_14_0_8_um_filter_36_36]PJA53740.1 MAG: DNA translocase FtsK [Candidatus Roizmanbacteria bacterium CG_4_9_14_3_um_filter_36_11]PJE60203.1 MAG: DNA translocase FtsK [Candidatus Roizmanbacteria bacterium CG10_big_fil_re